jgi:uncharacterized protein YbjT (DUF2867 family)
VVTGGTGKLGRVVVDQLIAAGHEVKVMSRRRSPAEGRPRCQWATADLVTGEGVGAATSGSGVVVHCATSGSGSKDVTATKNLIEAARHADSPHLVYISIVGVDRVPLGYYRGKLAAETLVERSGVPHTILRATQFHDLLRVLFAWTAKLPVMLVPALRFQPVDVQEVAARLVELATGDPVGRAADMGGPQVRDAADLARAYLAVVGRDRAVLPVRLPGKAGRGYRLGGHLAPNHAVGRTTFEQYLAGLSNPMSTSYRNKRQ